MGFLGISSLENLVGLLLMETAWWSTQFVSGSLLYFLYPNSADKRFTMLLLAKVLVQGLPWVAFFQNKEVITRRYVLWVWFWLGLVIELFLVCFKVMDNEDERIEPSFYLFYFIRAVIWLQTLVEIHLYEVSEPFSFSFIQRKRGSLIRAILCGEVYWYGVSVLTVLQPNWKPYMPSDRLPIPWFLNLGAGLISFVALVSIHKEWRWFLRKWVVIYAIVNLVAYTLFSAFELIDLYSLYKKFYVHFITLLPLSAFVLKIVFICGYNDWLKSEPEPEPKDPVEPQHIEEPQV